MAIFIRYQTKQGKTYAQLMDALRVDGKKRNIYIANLGNVWEINIYNNLLFGRGVRPPLLQDFHIFGFIFENLLL